MWHTERLKGTYILGLALLLPLQLSIKLACHQRGHIETEGRSEAHWVSSGQKSHSDNPQNLQKWKIPAVLRQQVRGALKNSKKLSDIPPFSTHLSRPWLDIFLTWTHSWSAAPHRRLSNLHICRKQNLRWTLCIGKSQSTTRKHLLFWWPSCMASPAQSQRLQQTAFPSQFQQQCGYYWGLHW